MREDLRDVLRRTVDSYERERRENAEREEAAINRLEQALVAREMTAQERVSDLLDIIFEMYDGLTEALPFAENRCGLPLRTIRSRAEDCLRQAGVL